MTVRKIKASLTYGTWVLALGLFVFAATLWAQCSPTTVTPHPDYPTCSYSIFCSYQGTRQCNFWWCYTHPCSNGQPEYCTFCEHYELCGVYT